MLHEVGVAVAPLNATVLVPCEPPKFEPEIVTELPTPPDKGESPLMVAGTVNVTPLLAAPFTDTITGPVDAPEGTGV